MIALQTWLSTSGPAKCIDDHHDYDVDGNDDDDDDGADGNDDDDDDCANGDDDDIYIMMSVCLSVCHEK